VKLRVSSNNIQEKNILFKYIILFCFIFLKDFAFFFFFFFSFCFVEVDFGVDSIWNKDSI
jgi:hypothetical protein